jgi:hypothetical protein
MAMGVEDMETGNRRAKQVVLTLALLSLVLIVAASAYLVFDAITVLAIMAVLLWMRIVRSRWASLQMQTVAAAPGNEDTGVWGVGGPGMRTPGATGIYGPIPGRQTEQDRRRD